jgi:CheY-like chemotaxis protein
MSDGYKVLVVDDNDFVRMQIVRFLRDAEYNVLEASEGEEAFGIVSSDGNIDLAIVDIRMEPVGGIEFVRNMRDKDISTPVVFITCDETAGIIGQTVDMDNTAVLMKPVMKDVLLKTVSETIVS